MARASGFIFVCNQFYGSKENHRTQDQRRQQLPAWRLAILLIGPIAPTGVGKARCLPLRELYPSLCVYAA